jgi:hypothetical protein
MKKSIRIKKDEKVWKALGEYLNQPTMEVTYRAFISRKDMVEFTEAIDKAFMEQKVDFSYSQKEVKKADETKTF